MTLISKYGLDAKQYNTEETGVTWETCTLRKWLNSDFLNEAFSAEELAMLKTVTVSANTNPKYSTDAGNSTQDTVFLLSIDEVNRYFDTDDTRVCIPTEKATVNGSNTDNKTKTWWWLRTPGSLSDYASYVGNSGTVYCNGYSVCREEGVVRPVVVMQRP